MKNCLSCLSLLIVFASTRAKDEELPLCPTNFQFFPQSLPMHCRMPTGSDFPSYPGMSGMTMQPPLADKQPMPLPMPPGMPMPMPGAMPMPGPMPIPGAMPFPGAMPGPMMPMPGPMMPGPAPGHKLPVIVMPFYSPDTSFKKPVRPKRPGGPGWKRPRRPHEYTSSDTSSDTDITGSDTSSSSDTSSDVNSSSDNGWWKGKKYGWRKNGRRSSKKHHSHHSKRRHNKKKDILTPVLQYVTKDGYVIYEKTISKGEAKDWLRVNKEEQPPAEQNVAKNDEGLDASIHEEQKVEIEEVKTNRENVREDDAEKEEEEITTPKVHLRRHHRKEVAPAINTLLPKRAF